MREGMSLGRPGVLALAGLLLTAGLVVGASHFFAIESGSQVEESVTGGQIASSTWADPIYPHAETATNVSLTNTNATTSYPVKIVLEGFTDVDGRSGLDAARDAGDSAFIGSVTIAGDPGYEVDLLNDGVAYYHSLPPATTQEASIVLDTHEDLDTFDSRVRANISWYRVQTDLESDSVKTHESRTDTCGTAGCHGTSKPVAVHAERGVGSDCESCHGRSMQDLHMSCVAGCHEGYPIRFVNQTTGTIYDHGPETVMNTDLGTGRGAVADYYCGANCHGSQISSSHTYILGEDYCGQCHAPSNSTIRDFHTSLSSDCVTCHGLSSEEIHARYEITDSNNQCRRCHATPLG